MTSDEIRDALLEAINEDPKGELRALLMGFPERIEKTVEEFTPVLTGQTVKSISTKHRRTEYKRLSTRRIKIGEVFSDDDPVRVGAIEYGRNDTDEHGGSPEHAMFRRAAAYWDSV